MKAKLGRGVSLRSAYPSGCNRNDDEAANTNDQIKKIGTVGIMNGNESILIIDDDEDILKSLALIFGKKGYETEVIKTGRKAIEKAQEKSFNLALADIKLPDMDGIDLIAPLKKMRPDMPIILITAYASLETAVRALGEGVSGYITKPLNMDEVLVIVRQALEKQHLVFEKRQIEKALCESEERLSNFMDSAIDGFAFFDSELNLVEVNKAALKIYPIEIKKEDVIAKNILDIIPGLKDSGRYEEYMKVLRAEKQSFADNIVLPTQCGVNHLDVKAFKVGKGLGIVIRDVTLTKRMEEENIQLEKIAALGTFIAGIAHEMNNPMMGVLNFIQYCIKHTSENDRRYTVLQDAERATNDCIKTIKNLLNFTRIEKEEVEEFQKTDCAGIFDQILKLLSYRIEKENVSVTRHIQDGTPETWIKVTGIQQVFLNIMGNALDAVKESKKKHIDIDIRPEGEGVRVAIGDSGCGIDTKTSQKIFDPFFTTKPTGKGTGLGLSVCRGIVDAHGGKIICESEVGVGATFKVSLPIERKKAEIGRGVLNG